MTDALLSRDQALATSRLLSAHARHVSDVAAANLFLFRHAHQYRLVDGPLPHVAGSAYDGTRLVLPLFSLKEANTADLARLLRDDGWLYPYTTKQVQRLGPAWQTGSDPGDSDYVYRTGDLATLTGSHDRRRQEKHFAQGGAIEVLPLSGADATDMARQVLDRWLTEVGKAAEHTDYRSCREALAEVDALDLFGLVILRDGDLVGFVLASAPWDDMAVIHFAKGLRSVEGVYPFMFAEFARRQIGRRWISFEQDLGNPRFRQAKRAFGPDHLLAKYRIRPR